MQTDRVAMTEYDPESGLRPSPSTPATKPKPADAESTPASPTATIYRSRSAMYRELGTVPPELVDAIIEKEGSFQVVFEGPYDPRNPQNWRCAPWKPALEGGESGGS